MKITKMMLPIYPGKVFWLKGWRSVKKIKKIKRLPKSVRVAPWFPMYDMRAGVHICKNVYICDRACQHRIPHYPSLGGTLEYCHRLPAPGLCIVNNVTLKGFCIPLKTFLKELKDKVMKVSPEPGCNQVATASDNPQK